MAKFNTDYVAAGANKTELTPELAEDIRQRFDADRENRFELYVLAAGIRKRYIDKRTKAYQPHFQAWYEKHKMAECFGSLANFTRYAAAGDVVIHTSQRTSNPEGYLRQLPVSVGALYECSQILNTRKTGKDDFIRCLNMYPTRTSLEQSPDDWGNRAGKKVIHSKATEADIRNWRRKWENPPPPKQKRTDKRTLELATIYVSGELFDFDERKGSMGDKLGNVDMPDVEAFMKKLEALFADPSSPFKLTDNLDYLTEGYTRRRDRADPANRIGGSINKFFGMSAEAIAEAKKNAAKRKKKAK